MKTEGTSNLLDMVLGFMEGQIWGGYFLDSILDPSVIDRTAQSVVQAASQKSKNGGRKICEQFS